MARPRKELDQTAFEKLCGLQCTKEEICDWFDVSDKTLDGWCKRTYKCSFSVIYEQKRQGGKIALRRMQWRLAERNAAMAMFLGKNYLGQSDAGSYSYAHKSREDDPLTESLKEAMKDGFIAKANGDPEVSVLGI